MNNPNKPKALYICDPEKNTQCTKEGCAHNPDSKYPVCEYTTKRKCSTDGKPIPESKLLEVVKEEITWKN